MSGQASQLACKINDQILLQKSTYTRRLAASSGGVPGEPRHSCTGTTGATLEHSVYPFIQTNELVHSLLHVLLSVMRHAVWWPV